MTKIFLVLLRKVTLERLVNSVTKAAGGYLLLLLTASNIILWAFHTRISVMLVLAPIHFAPMLQNQLLIHWTWLLVDVGVLTRDWRHVDADARVLNRRLRVVEVVVFAVWILVQAYLINRFLERQSVMVQYLVILIMLEVCVTWLGILQVVQLIEILLVHRWWLWSADSLRPLGRRCQPLLRSASILIFNFTK